MLKDSLQLIMNTINSPDLPLENLREARIVISDEYTLSKKYERTSKVFRYSYRLLSCVFGLSSGISLKGYLTHSFTDLDLLFAILALLSLGLLVTLLIIDKSTSDEETAPSQKLLLYGNIVDSRIFEKEFRYLDFNQKTLRQLAKLRSDINQNSEINKSQLNKYFWLGVSVMIFGAAVIIVTITLGTSSNQIGSVISGLVSGVLIDYIGVIFIKMYAGMIESISKFQKSVFEDSRIYLANALTSQIGNETLKDQTISDVAKSIVLKSGT